MHDLHVEQIAAQAILTIPVLVVTFFINRAWSFAQPAGTLPPSVGRDGAGGRAPARRRRARTPPARPGPRWWLAAIILVTVGAGVLRLISLGTVPEDLYYDAAVRSMTLSLHNFFFGAFDPSAQTSIDKPPLDLWLQVISVKLFGFGSGRPQAAGGDRGHARDPAAVRPRAARRRTARRPRRARSRSRSCRPR